MAGVSHARAAAAKLSPNAPSSSTLPLPSKVSGYAKRMAGAAQALKPKLADNVALTQKPFMVARPARREANAA